MTPALARGVRHAVFLDIDGTYAHRGVVPPAHAAAVRRARAAGHLVFLCTGRPKSMVPPRIFEAGFDGFIGGAGAYVEVDQVVLADVRFPPALAARALEVLRVHDAAFILEGTDSLWGLPGVDVRLTRRLSAHLGGVDPAGGRPLDLLDGLRMTDDLAAASFGKVTCFDSLAPIPTLAEQIGPEVAALPSSIPGMGPTAGELYLVGMHKAVGMRLVIEALALDPGRVVGVGDGLNDLEMLEEAAIGVAMAGADPRVLAAADLVADGPAQDGLARLFSDLGLF